MYIERVYIYIYIYIYICIYIYNWPLWLLHIALSVLAHRAGGGVPRAARGYRARQLPLSLTSRFLFTPAVRAPAAERLHVSSWTCCCNVASIALVG